MDLRIEYLGWDQDFFPGHESKQWIYVLGFENLYSETISPSFGLARCLLLCLVEPLALFAHNSKEEESPFPSA